MFGQAKSNLDKIAIASPCSAKWAEMDGDLQTRHCNACKLDVYNISEMTCKDAEAFLQTSSGKRCLRLYRRNDGTIVTKDCPIGRRIADGIKLQVRAVAATFIALLNATVVFGEEGKLVLPDEFFPVHRLQLMGESSEGVEAAQSKFAQSTANEAFEFAKKAEAANKYAEALDAYQKSLNAMREITGGFDPKFGSIVATRYAHLLRKTHQTKLAKVIEQKYCMNKMGRALITPVLKTK